jgi:hypothetical protein
MSTSQSLSSSVDKKYLPEDDNSSKQIITKSDVDPTLFVPLLLNAMMKLHYEVIEDDDWIGSYLSAWANVTQVTSLTTESSIDALVDCVKTLVSMGCCVLSVKIVFIVERSLGIWIP